MVRYRGILLAAGSLSFGVGAARAGTIDEVWPAYWRAVRLECPAKRLDLLSPADLRDVLDGIKGGAGHMVRAKFDRAERKQCQGVAFGAGCANGADIALIERHDKLATLTAAVCKSFTVCRERSDCTAAPR